MWLIAKITGNCQRVSVLWCAWNSVSLSLHKSDFVKCTRLTRLPVFPVFPSFDYMVFCLHVFWLHKTPSPMS